MKTANIEEGNVTTDGDLRLRGRSLNIHEARNESSPDYQPINEGAISRTTTIISSNECLA